VHVHKEVQKENITQTGDMSLLITKWNAIKTGESSYYLIL